MKGGVTKKTRISKGNSKNLNISESEKPLVRAANRIVRFIKSKISNNVFSVDKLNDDYI